MRCPNVSSAPGATTIGYAAVSVLTLKATSASASSATSSNSCPSATRFHPCSAPRSVSAETSPIVRRSVLTVQSAMAYAACRLDFSAAIRPSGSPDARSGRSVASDSSACIRARIVDGWASRLITAPVRCMTSRFSGSSIMPPPVATTICGHCETSRSTSDSSSRKTASPSVANISGAVLPVRDSISSSVSAKSMCRLTETCRATVDFPV